MTIGELLLLACVKKKDHKVLSQVQKRLLDGPEVVQYAFVMDYFKEHGEIIDVSTFCDKFKLDASKAGARPTYYLKEVKERYIFAVLSDAIPKVVKGLKASPRDKLDELRGIISDLSADSNETKDTLYSDDVDSRVADYEDRMKSKGVTYLSMGSPDMDATFYGYRKQDLITIGGRPGVGKTWVLIFLAYLLERVIKDLEESGEEWGDILFITNEMGEEEIKERFDCIKFKLPYADFCKGTLSVGLRKKYYAGLERMKRKKSKIRIVYSCQTTDELATLIGLYNPSAVFLDGSYLMEPTMQEGWEKIVYITRSLKRCCKNFATPIINTTQLKRNSGKKASKETLDGQDEFAYSGSYAQDSDIAFRMFQDADMKFHDLVGLEVVKGRRVMPGTTVIFQNDLTKMVHSLTLPVDGEELPTEHIEL